MKNDSELRREITQEVLRHVKAVYPTITQTQIASILGTDRSAVSNWFTGHKSISIHLLVKLAEVLNLSLDYLVFGTNQLEDTVEKINRILLSSQLETVYAAKNVLQMQEEQLLKLKENLGKGKE